MLETREVLPLGATNPEAAARVPSAAPQQRTPVDVRVCAATWRNLREEVAAGRFREDLYFRIGQPEVRLAPLRERLEEVPWHVQQVLDACAGKQEFRATADFLEACSLRHWPGNVRELRAEVRRSAAMVAARGSFTLNTEDLSAAAGQRIERPTSSEAPPSFPADEFSAALRAEHGNVLAAARQLGVHRNKVRRWLERHRVDPRAFRA